MKLFESVSFLYLVTACFFMFSFQSLSAQDKVYKKFFHPNGTVSAEGYLENGNPVGVWKSYYPDGTLKSVGKRTETQPDSTWKFFDRQGFLTNIISYNKGERNGYTENYDFADDTARIHYLESKVLYLNGKKNGASEYYRPDGSLERTVEYEDGYKHGYERLYNEDGLIVSIIRYSYDNIIDSENINRTDRYGQKQGIWKTFHPNFQLKTFASYLDGELHGYYREYNMKGELKKNEYYIRGEKQNLEKETASEEENMTEYKKIYYSDGTLKSEGSYSDTIPTGIHKFYDAEGKFSSATVYDSAGVKTASGKYTTDGKRVGLWKEYFADGSLKAKGEYKNDLRQGPWEFYFPDGSIEQKGTYNNGQPNGSWQWYYKGKKLRRIGAFRNGKEHGEFIEYTQSSDTLSFGYYSEGYKQGEWKQNVNGRKFIYPYNYGLKDGTAREYYSDGTLAFEGNYVSDMADGEHLYFYPNGKVKLRASYFSGQRTGKWYRYDEAGNLITVSEYKNDKKVKIDGTDLDIDN